MQVATHHLYVDIPSSSLLNMNVFESLDPKLLQAPFTPSSHQAPPRSQVQRPSFPDRTSFQTRTTHIRGRSRAYFDLSDDEDSEYGGPDTSREPSLKQPYIEGGVKDGEGGKSHEEDTPRPSTMTQRPMLGFVESQRADLSSYELRRWNALVELVHTEAGYVHDLRALVNVCTFCSSRHSILTSSADLFCSFTNTPTLRASDAGGIVDIAVWCCTTATTRAVSIDAARSQWTRRLQRDRG